MYSSLFYHSLTGPVCVVVYFCLCESVVLHTIIFLFCIISMWYIVEEVKLMQSHDKLLSFTMSCRFSKSHLLGGKYTEAPKKTFQIDLFLVSFPFIFVFGIPDYFQNPDSNKYPYISMATYLTYISGKHFITFHLVFWEP